MGWSNKKYADWMISNRVKEGVLCLVEVECERLTSCFAPKGLFSISKDGIRGKDLQVPLNGKPYQMMYWLKSKGGDVYVIGLSEVFMSTSRGYETI